MVAAIKNKGSRRSGSKPSSKPKKKHEPEKITLLSAEESFRIAWKEAQRGETKPIAQLWDESS